MGMGRWSINRCADATEVDERQGHALIMGLAVIALWIGQPGVRSSLGGTGAEKSLASKGQR